MARVRPSGENTLSNQTALISPLSTTWLMAVINIKQFDYVLLMTYGSLVFGMVFGNGGGA